MKFKINSMLLARCTFTSPPPMPPGSIRSSASSPSSLNALSVGALSTRQPTSSKKSIASFVPTMQIRSPSCGLPLPTQFFGNSRDFVSEFPGQNTSNCWTISVSDIGMRPLPLIACRLKWSMQHKH